MLLALALGGCRDPGRGFHLAGTVTIPAKLHPGPPNPRETLVIIVKNKGGVPVALARVVDPNFPVSFVLGGSDLILPIVSPDEPLWLEAELTEKIRLGPPQKGDWYGALPDPVHPGDNKLYLKIDRKL